MSGRQGGRRRRGGRGAGRSSASLPPRPTIGPAADHAAGEQPAPSHLTRAAARPSRLVEREAPYLIAELRRIAMVSAACLGLLALLVVVDRAS